ncbi:type IV secretory system conjugative DNA transfer family protein [Thalassovita sp.]|uniref:type IV secretory system conjugative DNA transfer family protein n=1 Tax=Thalassovita sp. TaxID=1979401 RepID=UPI002882464A|nr:TraM recognition domain-containing protein [Thalassovita sp.]MDF1803192.1 TraM recognition domain-containing protein [Thalassovita sp.]
MTKSVKRLLGLSAIDGKAIYAPKHSHSLLLSAAGGGKTSCGALPWLLSLLPDHNRSIIINDCKDGEIAAQAADMCARYGRNVAIIDDFGVLGEENPYRVSLSPFGSLRAAQEKQNGELVFAIDNANYALIPEPPNDAKNQFFRDEPRTLQEFCENELLSCDPSLAVPGGVWSMLADPDVLLSAARIALEEGDEVRKALGAHVLDMQENSKEHWGQHRAAALKSLRIYGAASPLHRAGCDAVLTHEDLLKGRYIVFIVGPQRHMARLGPHYALHLQSFIDVVLSGQRIPVDFILDESTNAPLKSLISAMTVVRGYGANLHFIAQSRSEMQRAYSDKETATIEENAIVKQYFGFSSFEECERISRAIGETLVQQHSVGLNSGVLDYTANIGTGKDRLISAERLMRMKPNEQLIHVKNVGWILCLKVGQHQVAPFCHGELADNPHEGPQLLPDPKVTIPIKKAACQ